MKKLNSGTRQTTPASRQQAAITALQYHQMTLVQKAKYAATFGVPTGLALEVMGAGGGGLAFALLVGLTTGYFSEEDKAGFIDKLPLPREKNTARHRKLRWWLTGEEAPGPQLPQEQQPSQAQTSDQVQAAPLSEIDQLFQAEQAKEEVVGIQRLHPNDIIRHTEPDDYRICIGRSLTRPGNPPVWINFYCQHLKIIGASQYGKSSMAAYLLYLITRTHAPENVRIALLDLENKTSKLFLDCHHVAKVCIDVQWVKLHAKSYEEVLEHLEYCVWLMNERYKLTEEEVEQEPLLVVYIEEFLDLKDYYNRLPASLTQHPNKKPQKNNSQLVFRVSQLARRGLKVKIQLLLCAQVDYRDDDFAESLANITA